jgi:hypothetical protein
MITYWRNNEWQLFQQNLLKNYVKSIIPAPVFSRNSLTSFAEIVAIHYSSNKLSFYIKALTETDGDIDKAIDYLREKGIAKAAKKADRIAAEGLVSFS